MWVTTETINKTGSRSIDYAKLQTVTILGNEIPSIAFNYRIICHQNKLRLNSASIFTVTATSQGLFAPLGGCLCLIGITIILQHLFLTQYFELSIVYIYSFLVEIPLWQSKQHPKSNNVVVSIIWSHSCVHLLLLGMLVAVLNGCTVETTNESLSLLRDRRCRSTKRGMHWKSNTWHRTLSSPWILNRISRPLIHEVPRGSARWRLGHFVFH
jgi:hypothetical protein